MGKTAANQVIIALAGLMPLACKGGASIGRPGVPPALTPSGFPPFDKATSKPVA